MIRINIITNISCPNSKAFNCPLLVSRTYFEENGYKLDFHWKISENVFDCDALFINSNVFRSYWNFNKLFIFNFLEKAVSRKLKILWFDTTDSTWCTQFEVMPYVDIFLKSQILKDRTLYLKRFRTGRYFTDFFDSIYDSEEKEESYTLPTENDLCKMRVSWNTCFENYTESRFGLWEKLKHRARPFLSSVSRQNLNIRFTPPDIERSTKISCRVGLSHSRPSIVAHRKAVINIIGKMGIQTSKIDLPKYFSELRNSQIGIGPFGLGEITLRDFEIIICGATLIKPDMGHLETWPNLFQTDRTFVGHKWDLSDLDDKIQGLLDDKDRRINIACNAQKVYRDAISEEGLANFAKRLVKLML